MKANTLTWYKDRIMAMSLSEILWRVSMWLKKKRWKLSRPGYNPKISRQKEMRMVELQRPEVLDDHAKKLIQEADKYLSHDWLFFGLKDCHEEKIDWHKDPVSGISAPHKFGFDINHRDETIVGNIKFTWEKNRHHHLTVLAEAFFISGDERYAKEVEVQLRSWIEENPYLIGVNWTHPLEQGIRLISWVFIYNFLKRSASFDTIFGEDGFIWTSIYEHQKFIVETYSRGSSANNHLIGEMSGLVMACFTWPIFRESDRWQKLGLSILERELKMQTYDDGINKELAFSYQIFVFEFCILPLYLNKKAFSEQYVEILRRMSAVMASLTSIMGSIPNYGDGDEGMALQIQDMQADRLQWLLELSNKLLATNYRSDSRSLPGRLLNINNDIASDDQKQDESQFVSKEAGLYAFKKNISDKSVAVMFDFGPLGLGSMAAHGHADALSFIMALDEQMIFIDPGTFCYHTDLNMREYFRSVQAHNAISIDGMDQSEQAGPFLWKKKAEVNLVELDTQTLAIEASHNGYEEIGVIHTRRLQALDSGIFIMDSLSGSGDKHIELRFHLHPDFNTEISDNTVLISNEVSEVKLHFDTRFSIKTLFGGENGGWYSTKFGIKQPCNTLVLNGDLSLPAQIETNIEIIR